MQVATTTQTQNPSASSVASAKLADNFDSFLKLLTTQLQYQDPLQPLDSKEFVAQLVQFSQVEQSIQSNQSLEKLIALQNTGQTTAALGYIGKKVEYDGDIAPLTNGSAEFSYTLPQSAAAASVVIRNEAGQVVQSVPGQLSAGKHSFVWDGTGSGGATLPDGNYRISVVANDTDGKLVEGVKTTAFGTVTGVDSSDSGVSLDLSGATASLDTVLAVR